MALQCCRFRSKTSKNCTHLVTCSFMRHALVSKYRRRSYHQYGILRFYPSTPGLRLSACTKGFITNPDLTWSIPESESHVYVFGVNHRKSQSHVGEFILSEKPEAVVVETAVTSEHGAQSGNAIIQGEAIAEGQDAFFLRIFSQVAEQLKQEGGTWINSSLWQNVNLYHRGEQLAYITAFAVGAKLIFGDRPKDITYRRLAALTSSQDLDEMFGKLCQDHYRGLVNIQPTPMESELIAHNILMTEREAVLCGIADSACRGFLPQAGIRSPIKKVVMVVGDAHVQGLNKLWHGKRWREMVPELDIGSASIMSSPSVGRTTVGAREDGVHRGLMHAMMRMMVTNEVLAHMEHVLGPVPDNQRQSFDAVEEIYGSSRMMLATLPPELLHKVCCGLHCSMPEVLEPFRKLRPLNKGLAYTEEMITHVRSLNFELE
ncbi:hypothetical protein CEUSTIGMA_g6917.t1 [Chlamydomonas eustigma]|uniref:Uncharacterized protein n=1 Tax=Chlamydomonas eustigma TaxID=1157962 RepID=A0A250X8T7_9CHLO|nr:hypothetical protein CEUSTIGMA_g6917.t1 [Chlamydomonas eustigma]|eukprot:GAX79476.1 hypothetical protein CEUSTIGMA_g6917.t1 [Chlamydomonas eustigma]